MEQYFGDVISFQVQSARAVTVTLAASDFDSDTDNGSVRCSYSIVISGEFGGFSRSEFYKVCGSSRIPLDRELSPSRHLNDRNWMELWISIQDDEISVGLGSYLHKNVILNTSNVWDLEGNHVAVSKFGINTEFGTSGNFKFCSLDECENSPDICVHGDCVDDAFPYFAIVMMVMKDLTVRHQVQHQVQYHQHQVLYYRHHLPRRYPRQVHQQDHQQDHLHQVQHDQHQAPYPQRDPQPGNRRGLQHHLQHIVQHIVQLPQQIVQHQLQQIVQRKVQPCLALIVSGCKVSIL
eukprot:TRINITY_DN24_c0_g1_i6.p1 TRINITY_DN24_c0_g1~~TRINITY_DN24_c0_g1_i6.p1  ORF type:complete len:292 (-),score=41.24 TRINITY_DN24_c0_g1_i6:578-1453(-)